MSSPETSAYKYLWFDHAKHTEANAVGMGFAINPLTQLYITKIICMKSIRFGGKVSVLTVLATLIFQVVCFAQDEVVIKEQDISSWFAQNWMWVAGGVILLLLIVLFGRGSSSKRRSTTVVKDQYGDVKSVTTIEEKD